MNAVSLTPRFSAVAVVGERSSRFNGLNRDRKAVKTSEKFSESRITALKPWC
jgi:hypothetical protein